MAQAEESDRHGWGTALQKGEDLGFSGRMSSTSVDTSSGWQGPETKEFSEISIDRAWA